MGRRYKPEWQKELALERIIHLFSEAEGVFHSQPAKSHEYVTLARKIAMRYRVRIPKEFKKHFCKHCYSYLKPGVNCTIRLNQKRFSKIVITCKECEQVTRIPYKLARK